MVSLPNVLMSWALASEIADVRRQNRFIVGTENIDGDGVGVPSALNTWKVSV